MKSDRPHGDRREWKDQAREWQRLGPGGGREDGNGLENMGGRTSGLKRMGGNPLRWLKKQDAKLWWGEKRGRVQGRAQVARHTSLPP